LYSAVLLLAAVGVCGATWFVGSCKHLVLLACLVLAYQVLAATSKLLYICCWCCLACGAVGCWAVGCKLGVLHCSPTFAWLL